MEGVLEFGDHVLKLPHWGWDAGKELDLLNEGEASDCWLLLRAEQREVSLQCVPGPGLTGIISSIGCKFSHHFL